MAENYNNIISNFFKKTAEIWSSAAKYQIFVILTAIVLLAVLPLFGTEMKDTVTVIFNILIFCMIAAAGFLLLRFKGTQMAAFTFATALVLRLCLIFVLENSTPYMTEDIKTRTSPWIKYYDSVLFQPDEYFYAYQGQRYSDTTVSEFINSPEFAGNAFRAGFLMSRLFSFFGEETIWPRIVGALLGAFAAACVCLTAEELFSKTTSAIISLLAALAPQTALYSVRFLKEIWVIFAASLILLGFVMIIRNKKFITAILLIAMASILLAWIRLEYGLMLIFALPLAASFRRKSSSIGKSIVIIPMIILGIIIFLYQLSQMTGKVEYLFDKYTSTEQAQRGRIEVMDRIYKSRGPLRLLNIPLTILNPPPKNLHCIYTEENRLFDIVLLADIYQWWIPLPFLIIGAVTVITQRKELLVLLLPYILALSTSAMLLGGLEPNLLRYRDSLAPIAFIIIGTGIETFITSPKSWKHRIILTVYALFVLLTVYFYIRDF
jgi:hypothetical protein